MKRKQILTVLFTSVIISGIFSCFSCTKIGAKARKVPTIIQIQTPNADGRPGAQTTFNYELFYEPLIEFYGEAFPVKILSTATLNAWPDGSPRMIATDDYIGDSLGDFGVTVSLKGSSGEPVSVRIEIEGGRFIKRSGLETILPLNREIEIFPRIAYDYDALSRLVQPASENVYFRLFYGSALLAEKMEVVRFHSVNEVPFRIIDRRDDESIEDYTWLFAAYVNENDPLIDKITQEALKLGVAEKIGLGSTSFAGYQIEDEVGDAGPSVDSQVLAVWSVFLNHNIKYSNITTTSTENPKMNTQYVRTLGESFGNSQANCVDGSALFASVLRKIGIHPFLVLVPGHMLVGYLRDNDPFSLGFLETTMMGNVDISKHTRDDSLLGELKRWSGLGQTQSSVTLNSFLAAQSAGEDRYYEALIFLFLRYYENGQYLKKLMNENAPLIDGFFALLDENQSFYKAFETLLEDPEEQVKLWDEEDDDYALINVFEMRSVGIMPVIRN